MREHHVKTYFGVTVNEITKNSVKITLGDGTVKELACDTVILGVSMKHNEERLEKMMGIIR